MKQQELFNGVEDIPLHPPEKTQFCGVRDESVLGGALFPLLALVFFFFLFFSFLFAALFLVYEGLDAWHTSAMSMMTSTLLLAYRMTGNDTHLAPMEAMAEIRWQYLRGHLAGGDEPGSAAWCAKRMRGAVSNALGKYRLLTGDRRYDVLLRTDASGYVKFRLTGSGKLSRRICSQTPGRSA